ncbi:carcinoembryonic antigen-related cell adhesion molecule 19 isoform X1 [Fukomys damarensis]|uniref:carcinoembryonic antigen-related cell adhesion molecule 19 isoform X1 n=1 Tax=Fukomys damarensis TaxID=885580 RepID=UPI001455C8F1|nr:carcinoembryonic antigen-related cell adhesion molecule 19 isoform X1 [Fukomys damarensis]
METPGTQSRFSMGLLLSASVLALWMPQGAQAALHIQKIPEQPQKNQDLFLSVQGVPGTFQDFVWYLGEEADGGTRLFTYIPGLQRPQRDGNAMGQRDIVGFPNGSMLLRHAQASDSGTYQVAITVNPSWTMRAKTEVRVAEKQEDLSAAAAHLPMNAGIVVAAIMGPLATGALLISAIVWLLVMRARRAQSPRETTAVKPELSPPPDTGDNIYEVMPSPDPLVSPLRDVGTLNSATRPAPPPPRQPEPENHHYQDLLNPDPAPYCQLVPTSS